MSESQRGSMNDLNLSQLVEGRGDAQAETGNALRADVQNLNFWYGDFQALKGINLPVHDKKVTALIGASGCGKSTLLRCFNRMHDLYRNNRYDGAINLYPEGDNIVGPKTDPMLIRLRVGWCSKSPILSPSPFTKMLLPACVFAASTSGLCWMTRWRLLLPARPCGRK